MSAPRPLLSAVVCTGLLGALLTGCGSATPATGKAAQGASAGATSSSPAPPRRVDPLAYVDEATYRAHKADYAERKVALFFWASWCPNCRAHDEYINDTLVAGNFPRDLTIVKVDYDVRTDLERTYRVTQQDTFVPIDANGKALDMPLVSPPDYAILGLAA
jgi:thioredoxin 1